jgi:hypothetical protein
VLTEALEVGMASWVAAAAVLCQRQEEFAVVVVPINRVILRPLLAAGAE